MSGTWGKKRVMRSTTPPRRHKSCFHVTQPIDTHAVSRYLHIMSHVPSLRKSRIAFGSLSVFFFSSFLAIGCDQKTAPVEPGPEKIVAIETAPPPSVAATPANSAKEPEQPVASATSVRAPTTTTPPSQGPDPRHAPKSTASAAEEQYSASKPFFFRASTTFFPRASLCQGANSFIPLPPLLFRIAGAVPFSIRSSPAESPRP